MTMTGRYIACRKGCGACCIAAPSITSPVPGMTGGKPAGRRCVQLSSENLCLLFGKPDRPDFCRSYQATREFCGEDRDEAMRLLRMLEAATRGQDAEEEWVCSNGA